MNSKFIKYFLVFAFFFLFIQVFRAISNPKKDFQPTESAMIGPNGELIYFENDSIVIENDSNKNKQHELNKENFYRFCEENDIKFPEVVYAQACLESGHFKSKIFKTKNNHLGIYNSYKKDFYEYESWQDCLLGYKNQVQYKYTGSHTDRNEYLNWLKNLPYAEDPNYIHKVKNIIQRNI